PEGAKQSVAKITHALEESHVLIFAEGTFSYAAGLRPFKLGAFKIACDHNVPVLPIALQGPRQLLREHYLMRPVVIRVYVGKPIFPLGNTYQDYIQLRNEARDFIAANCGEPSLNYIVAGKAQADLP